MKRTSGRLGVGLLLVSMLVGACLTEGENGDVSMAVAQPQASLPEARDAKEVVFAVRSQLERAFGTTNTQLPNVRHSKNSLSDFDVVGVRGVLDTEALSLDGLLAEPAQARTLVNLPVRADGAFRLRDERSGLAIDVGLVGATASSREQSDGYVVYRSGYVKGAHIVHRPTEQGTEDYLYFPEELPETPELRYEVALGEGVAGLRLIHQTLEMLDSGGSPRLRMAPPYAVDGDGRRFAVNVEIEGCAYDTSAAMPWGRPTVQPGSRHCTVHLTWDSTAKAPLVVDPAWQSASNMLYFRVNMTATHLGGGKAIVIGGDAGMGTNSLNTTEYYNHGPIPSWAMGPQTGKQRADHAAILTDDSLYVIGGRYGSTITGVVERLPIGPNGPGTVWEGGVGMLMGRYKHTATLLPGKGILVAGGFDINNQPTSSAEFYSFGPKTWASRPMTSVRVGHTAAPIGPNTVLVVGGKGTAEPLNTMEVFDLLAMPEPGFAAVAGNMPRGRAFHTSTTLGDGRILIAGGESLAGVATAEVDIYHSEQNSWASNVPPMSTGRMFFAAAKAPFGDSVVVMGGKSTNTVGAQPLSSAEMYTVGAAQWKSIIPGMSVPRSNFSTFTLPGGYIVAVGGATGPVGATGTAELLGCSTDAECKANNAESYCSIDNICRQRKDTGSVCDVRSKAEGGQDCFEGNCHMCASGNCVDRVCCESECKGQCETCNAAGSCVPVVGSPVTNAVNEALPKRDICTAHDVCGGVCNGDKRDVCTYPKGNACDTTCTAASNKFESLACDGTGACNFVVFSQPCSPYACDSQKKECTTICEPPKMDGTLQSGCDDNTSVCNTKGQCIPRPTSCMEDGVTMKLADGTLQSCGNFRCVGVACLNVCDTVYDCFLPSTASPEQTVVCNDSRQCVLVDKDNPGGNDSSSGCSTSPANESSRFGWLAALAIAGAVASRRNRPRA